MTSHNKYKAASIAEISPTMAWIKRGPNALTSEPKSWLSGPIWVHLFYFDSLQPSQQFFSYIGTGLDWVEPVLSKD